MAIINDLSKDIEWSYNVFFGNPLSRSINFILVLVTVVMMLIFFALFPTYAFVFTLILTIIIISMVRYIRNKGKQGEKNVLKLFKYLFYIIISIPFLIMIWIIIDMVNEFGVVGTLFVFGIVGFIIYLLWEVFCGTLWRSRL
jgi:L-asparagine transporter-like permease